MRDAAARQPGYRTAALVVLGLATGWQPAAAQEAVQISVPPAVFFQVLDVHDSITASPTSISFTNAVLGPGRALRISVRAEGDLAPASGPAIPAASVSWVTSNASNGVGINGTLSTATYVDVYQSLPDAQSGGVDLTWTLSAPGEPRRAGNHQATLRWKVEAISP